MADIISQVLIPIMTGVIVLFAEHYLIVPLRNRTNTSHITKPTPATPLASSAWSDKSITKWLFSKDDFIQSQHLFIRILLISGGIFLWFSLFYETVTGTLVVSPIAMTVRWVGGASILRAGILLIGQGPPEKPSSGSYGFVMMAGLIGSFGFGLLNLIAGWTMIYRVFREPKAVLDAAGAFLCLFLCIYVGVSIVREILSYAPENQQPQG